MFDFPVKIWDLLLCLVSVDTLLAMRLVSRQLGQTATSIMINRGFHLKLTSDALTHKEKNNFFNFSKEVYRGIRTVELVVHHKYLLHVRQLVATFTEMGLPLTSLTLRYCNRPGNNFHDFLYSLPPTIVSLDLTGYGNIGELNLGKFLKLRKLILSNTCCESSSLKKLKFPPFLEHLVLNCFNWDYSKELSISFINFISQFPLKTISLHGCNLNNYTAINLTKCKTLTEIGCSGLNVPYGWKEGTGSDGKPALFKDNSETL